MRETFSVSVLELLLIFYVDAICTNNYYTHPITVLSNGVENHCFIMIQLNESLRIMQYQEVSAILIIILTMVTLVDAFSGWLRKRFS